MYLSRRCVIGASLALSAAVCQGQLVRYLYDWGTVYNNNNTGGDAIGQISVWDNGQVDVTIYNVSTEQAYIVGFWLYKPTDEAGKADLRAVDPVEFGNIFEIANPANQTDWLGTDWDVQTGASIESQVQAEFGTRDLEDFVGVHRSGNPNVDTIAQGFGGNLSFFFDTTNWPTYPGSFESHEFYPEEGTITAPDIVLRMRNVGDDGDSDKLRAILIGPPSLVPEPSTIGLLGVAGMGALLFIRRRCKAKK